MRVTFLTDPLLVAQKFHQVVPLLQPVIDQAARGELTVEDIRTLSESGRFITGIAEEGDEVVMAMVFEFIHYPRMLAVNIVALGGRDLETVTVEFWETFRAWCKSAGASVIEASCSEAMARMLRRQGFESTYRVVRSSL